MSEITQKISEGISSRETSTQNGKVWYYKLKMEDGSVGEIGKKKPDAFKAGDSLTYTQTDSQYGLKFKAVMQNGSGFGGGRGPVKGSTASFALSYCKDICVALIPLYPTKTPTEWTTTTLAMADKFNAWLKANEN